MMHVNTFVGLDVHARSIKAVALDVVTGEVRSAGFGYDHAAVAEWARSLPQPAKCVYESGVTGFDLQKRLSEDGVDCVIGAVSKMIKPAADKRRKNDRNDAEFLARMLAVGNVVEVWVPDDECEAARDLTRALEDAREETARSKQLLSRFLLRHGYVFDERSPSGQRRKNRTAAHWAWTESVSFEQKADRDALGYCIDRVKRALEDKKRLEGLVEAGEFSRFKNARSFAAWVGPTPSEHSSGESERRGGITKAGNRHLRKALVESAWHYLSASPRSKDLARGQSPARRRGGTRRRARAGSSNGGKRCWRGACRRTRRTLRRPASSHAGRGLSGAWRRRRRKAPTRL